MCLRSDLRQRHGAFPIRDGGRLSRPRRLRQDPHTGLRIVIRGACRDIHDRPSAQTAPETDRLPLHPRPQLQPPRKAAEKAGRFFAAANQNIERRGFVGFCAVKSRNLC